MIIQQIVKIIANTILQINLVDLISSIYAVSIPDTPTFPGIAKSRSNPP